MTPMRRHCAMTGRDQRRPTSIPIRAQGVRTRMALNLRPDSAISGGTVVAVARRYWRVSSLVLLLVALVAGARYVTAPRTYIATQDLTVALIHAQALGDPGDAALATSGALAVAHALARPEVITSSALADAVLARVPADTARR